jgi:phospholipase C
MRFIARILILLASLAATFTHAQTNIPQVQHVIIVVQENRTPDNLFGSDAFAQTRQLPGADLTQTGLCSITGPWTLQSIGLGSTCNPNHLRAAWKSTYDSGKMDGACTITASGCGTMTNPEYTYVAGANVVPYFQIATQYGYANYMFATNQGPSFPAHQFLLSGTSAPTPPTDLTDTCDSGGNDWYCYQWFAADLANSGTSYGCVSTAGTVIPDIDPSGNESPAYNNGYPCYFHNTLATLLDNQKPRISWKYYAQASSTNLAASPATSLWTAPNAIQGICYPLTPTLGGDTCGGYDWSNYVESVFPNAAGYPNSYSPILTDLGADPNQPQCTLPAVSWVVPDGNWSDHGSLDPDGAGPSWVSAILNAVGGYDDVTGGQLPTRCGYWANTVVLITWDDWGGWYDHILPWNCPPGPNGKCSGYPNGTGGEYVYGFRVPLMVVSAYNYRPAGSTGYISGACVAPGNCPNEKAPYVHDFGSILNFIEWTFGQNQQPLGAPYGIGPQQYPYADYFAPDAPNSPGCNPTLCPYSLHDFFDFSGGASTFTPITKKVNYKTQCFLTPSIPSCFGSTFTPADPDDDAVD